MKRAKHLVLVALMAVLVCGSASAGFRFGVKAGANFNSLHLSKDLKDNFNTDNTAGFTGGVMTEFTAPIIGIGFDVSLLYTHLNDELKTKSGQTVEEGSVGKNFLEIPVNFKYKIGLPVVSKIITPMVFTGPNFAFKLDKSIFNDIKTKTFQFGWNFGVGVELFKHLQIAGSYTLGVNNVLKLTGNNLPGIGNINNVKLKNNYWAVTAAYLF